jgi:hypothetical protein
MNCVAISAVGKIVGSNVVVVTLAYLASAPNQVRHRRDQAIPAA